MLVGPAGSGKSTHADILKESLGNCVVVSSDSIRQELFGDESIQGRPEDVFSICRDRCIDALNSNQNVVFDATNLQRKHRKSFLNYVTSKCKIPFMSRCIVVASTYEDCLIHNSSRERNVPEDVIRKHFNQFQMPLYSEGWNYIEVIQTSVVNLNAMLDRCKGFEHNNSHHKYNVYDHILHTSLWIVNHVDPTSEDLMLLHCLALWHDIGKLYTKVYTDKKGNPTPEAHFYSHEAWSSMYSLCDSFGNIEFKVKLGQLISLHMMKYQPEYDIFMKKWAPELKDLLDIFNRADAENA